MFSYGGGISRRPSMNGSVLGPDGQIEVLREGDVIGQGLFLQGQIIKSVSSGQHTGFPSTLNELPKRYEVIRKLGTGSYAVVYLVREILAPCASNLAYSPVRPPPPVIAEDDTFDESDVFGMGAHPSSLGLGLALGPRSASHRSSRGARRRSLLSSTSTPAPRQYGASFAIKVLSKSSLDASQIEVQRTEVTIHSSLPQHANIVTLKGTLETEDFLMLILEYVDGEDLYWFLDGERKGEVDVDGYSTSSKASSRAPSVLSFSALSLGDFDDDEDEFGEPIRGRSRKTRRDRDRASRQLIQDIEDAQIGMGSAGTPPTPSLLSSVQPRHMLSYERLKLIASMFGQMCDSVQVCVVFFFFRYS